MSTNGRESILTAVIGAQESFLRGTEPVLVFDEILRTLLRLTKSEHGFIAEIAEGEMSTLKPLAVSEIGWTTLMGVVGPRPRMTTVVSDRVASEAGIHHFIQFPLLENDHLLGCVGLINRHGGFDPEVESVIRPFLSTCGVLIAALHERARSSKALSELRQGEEVLRLALDGATGGVWDLDLVTKKLYVSDTWVANFGWDKEDVSDFEPVTRSVVHPEDLPRVVAALNNHIEGKTLKFETEYRMRCKDGRYVPVLGRGKVVKRDANGRALRMVGTNFDLTEYKKVQNELLDAQKNMIESAKFSALGVMAAGIAHEINNPLAIIQAYCEVLEDFERLNPAKLEKSRVSIVRSVERITKIVQGLRKVARDADGDPFEVVSAKSLIEEIMSFSNERILRKDIDLRIACDDRIQFQCQPVQLSQVLLNLLNNAIDAIEGQTEKWISFEAKIEGEKAIIYFSDSGPGVPQDVRNKIFDPFFTTKQVGKGTGLGLSISRSIVEDHGGRFYLSDSSLHTCFVIELPLAEAKMAETA
jgi:PAS domain S-box-containing protein